MNVWTVAMGLLREAMARKWFLALGVGITLLLVVIASALRLEVIDGALAASRLFGNDLNTDIQSVDVALRPVFRAASYVVYYGGIVCGLLACADFGPALLAPGRIEHLLSLPLRRWELLLGTFLGVTLLATGAALYGAGGFAFILGIKTGVWTVGPLVAGCLAAVAFVGLYGVMLSTSVMVRSAALSGLAGLVVFGMGIVASYRIALGEAINAGWQKQLFWLFTLPVPRVGTLADAASDLAASASVDHGALARLLAGVIVFGFASLAVGVWQFERQDY